MIKMENYFANQLSEHFPEREIVMMWRIIQEDSGEWNHLKKQDEKMEFLKNIIHRLIDNEPLQYIVGQAFFYDRLFEVNKSVLIPRPETEELVHLIIENHRDQNNLKILDIGTGSGCIPIILANHLKVAQCWGWDISDEALSIAKKNNDRYGDLCQFTKIDALNIQDTSQWNIIVSNPPYIPHLERELMSESTLKYEPELALFVSNENPFLFYDKISNYAVKNLEDGGTLYFEINEFLGRELVVKLEKKGLRNVQLHQDLQGKDRMISAEK